VRNKLKTPLPLRELLEQALARPFLGPENALDSLHSRWSDLVGEAVAAKSRPSRIVGRRLIVEVASSVWANELEFRKRGLLEKIRALPQTGDLEELRFQIEMRSSADRGLKTRPLKSFG
jgi:predicted nucleic acid-binding Zn ribbon protein